MIRVAITEPVTLPIPIHSGYLERDGELKPILASYGIELVGEAHRADFELRTGYSLLAGPPLALHPSRVIIVDGEPPQPEFHLPYYQVDGWADVLCPANLRIYAPDGLAYYPQPPAEFPKLQFDRKIIQLSTYRSVHQAFMRGALNGKTPYAWRLLCAERCRVGLEIHEQEPELIDICGHGWPAGVSKEASRKGDWWSRKIELVNGYGFNLCWENTEIPYYVTEKLWDPIIAGSLPLYWGPEEMHARLPAGSVVDCRRYATEDGFDVMGLLDEVLGMSEAEWRGRITTLRDWYAGFPEGSRNESLRSVAHELARAIVDAAERTTATAGASV